MEEWPPCHPLKALSHSSHGLADSLWEVTRAPRSVVVAVAVLVGPCLTQACADGNRPSVGPYLKGQSLEKFSVELEKQISWQPDSDSLSS